MLLGEVCTRACRFCHVKTGNPEGIVDTKEPLQTAESIQKMKLSYVVLTMVDRDDIADGGSGQVAKTVRKINELNPQVKIEILAGDFRGQLSSVDKVLKSGIQVYAHNIETVRRLSPRVRDRRADYDQSLKTLEHVKTSQTKVRFTKSALMLGLGETKEEVIESMRDLRTVGCDFITIGQYLRPTKKHLSIKEFVSPEVFKEYENIALELGFLSVASGPLIRSSYKAKEFYKKALKRLEDE